MPIVLYAAFMTHLAITPGSEFPWVIAVMFLIGWVAIEIFVIIRTSKTWNERQKVRHGLDGERAVAEELNRLMLDGARVFHDVPFTYGNIDHVVVTVSGVYAVETKMYGKLKAGETQAEVIVDHEQGRLRFPDRSVSIPEKQVETAVNWLRQYLKDAVGFEARVEGMVALPGWFIKDRIGRSHVFVFNPLNPRRFFFHDNRRILSAEKIQQIAHQLDRLCRDVEPVSNEPAPQPKSK
jgi:hypothetical protein